MYERIKELCRTREITIADLEKTLGFGTRTIYNWTSHAPSVDKVIAVAEYFGVSIDYLVTGKDAAAKQPETKTPELSPEVLEATLKLIEALKK